MHLHTGWRTTLCLRLGGTYGRQAPPLHKYTHTHTHTHTITHTHGHTHAHQVHQALEDLHAAQGVAERAAWAARDECVVCMDAPRTTRLRPCCHVLLCPACAAALVRDAGACPTCRAPVDRYEAGEFFATFVPT